MRLVHGFRNLGQPLASAVVTIGNFDGVHLGHRRIIEVALKKAKDIGGISVAYTFRPHPQIALRPGAAPQLLSTYDEKLEQLGALGVDLVIEEPFSREFSTTPAEIFFKQALVENLGARAVVVGYDFAFGKGREGRLDALERFCRDAGIELTVVPPQKVGGEAASSTVIRKHLLAGDVETANRLLGREFSYRGIVVRGDARGRTLGYPTANLAMADKLALPYGIYATRSLSQALGAGPHDSVTSLGVRPTFGAGAPPLVETFVLDAHADLYGSVLEVRFVKRLRDELKFGGVEALKAQIARDVEDARAALKAPKS